MNTKQILFFAKNGDIMNEVQPPFRAPLIELDSNRKLPFYDGCLSFDRQPSMEELKRYFTSIYRSWKHFGCWGDVIAVKELMIGSKYYYTLDYIGRLSFNKAGNAVDLMMLVKTKSENFLVGITRKNEPGKGKLAFPGGFIDVRGFHLDTPIETIVHEAEEEIGLKIKVLREANLVSYTPVRASVTVDYQGTDIKGELIPLGIFPTSDSEKIVSTGLKRVYTTTAFALLIDMTPTGLDETGLNQWLKAGDDAASLQIVSLKGFPKIEFGLEHHQMLYDQLLKNMGMFFKVF